VLSGTNHNTDRDSMRVSPGNIRDSSPLMTATELREWSRYVVRSLERVSVHTPTTGPQLEVVAQADMPGAGIWLNSRTVS